jgi:NAD-specific glutamate dehydrogenase
MLTVDHGLNLGRRELANRVGDGDVGCAARSLLGSSNLEDTVDIDLEDDFQNGIAGFHGRDGSKSELAQRRVVLAVDTLSLVDGKLHGLLVIDDCGERPLQ